MPFVSSRTDSVFELEDKLVCNFKLVMDGVRGGVRKLLYDTDNLYFV